jgi:hypothetical protein
VFKKCQKELNDTILNQLIHLFQAQIKSLENKATSKFKSDIAKVESKHVDEVVDNLDKLLLKLYEGSVASFIKQANSLVLDGSTWATKVIVFVNELKMHLNDLMQNCKKAILNKMEN